jgi:hypothetical protein
MRVILLRVTALLVFEQGIQGFSPPSLAASSSLSRTSDTRKVGRIYSSEVVNVDVSPSPSLFWKGCTRSTQCQARSSALQMAPENNNSDSQLDQKFGGFTVKQRLREEVESPFRQVRLFFFGSTAASASVALYFSALSLLKANIGGYSDAIPLNEALQTCGINLAGVVVCSGLAWREYQAGQTNLKRIAKGGALARLAVMPPADTTTTTSTRKTFTLADYRRTSRVVIAAGGKDYIQQLARSLTADQLSDENTIPQALAGVDMVVVPVLLEGKDGKNAYVGDTVKAWMETIAEESDSNFDITRANQVLAFPTYTGSAAWTEYLSSEIEQAEKQGFDSKSKGLTITVKKNGKILRRAAGQPRWSDYIGAMEVLDGSKFGMPGDSENYGGP